MVRRRRPTHLAAPHSDSPEALAGPAAEPAAPASPAPVLSVAERIALVNGMEPTHPDYGRACRELGNAVMAALPPAERTSPVAWTTPPTAE